MALALLLTACIRPARASESYAAYVPLVVAAPEAQKGLALSADWACGDMATVGASWYWDWHDWQPYCAGQTSAEYVPVALDGNPAGCYPVVMLFNEPDLWASPPTGAQLAQAVTDYEVACPAAEVWCCNFSHYGLGLAADFIAADPGFDGVLAVHWYPSSPQTLAEFLAAAQAVHPRVALTEFAEYGYENAATLAADVALLRSMGIERWAYMTNRCTTGDSLCDAGLEFVLFDAAGQLTPLGEAYKEQ